MLRVFVDSGSSIKQEEKEKYNVEILPLNILLDDKSYKDGVDLSMEEFYDKLINKKLFPKTSLPNLDEIQTQVNKFVEQGDDVLILPISSKISGTYNAIKMLFAGNPKVKVVDTLSAVGGIRLMVNEINKHRDESLDELEARIKRLIPRIKIMAIPETLAYLMRGGRLSKTDYLLGTMLNIKPVIGIEEGVVKTHSKKMGLKNAMRFILDALKIHHCDEEGEIIASYTYNKTNLDKLIEQTEEKYKKLIKVTDNLDPAIACHWGPNAFGYIFLSKKPSES